MESPKRLRWYRDQGAVQRGEPGIVHSYAASIATVLQHLSGNLDPVWLMGVSGFAFRIMATETLCPSAMSIFDWRKVLPEVIEQAGYHCLHISRLWHEAEHENVIRDQAHHAIVEALDTGIPPVVWDIKDCEWGVIVGYEPGKQIYRGLDHQGNLVELPFARLGRNGIDILSVIVLKESSRIAKSEAVCKALKIAIDHADQREWNDRPKYQDGSPAYDHWSTGLSRWAEIVEKGNPEKIGVDICRRARYYASHYYSARCYAREFLKDISDESPYLRKAAACFADVAAYLKPVWIDSPTFKIADVATLRRLSSMIEQAKKAEMEGIDHIREHVATFPE